MYRLVVVFLADPAVEFEAGMVYPHKAFIYEPIMIDRDHFR